MTAALLNTHIRDNENYLKGLTDTLISGFPVNWPGDEGGSLMGTAYPSGATIAARAVGTGLLVFDPALIPGTFKWEATLRAAASATATLALFETSAPDTKLVNSEITSTNADGARVQSAAITLPSGGSPKTFFAKGHSNHASAQAWATAIRIYPAS